MPHATVGTLIGDRRGSVTHKSDDQFTQQDPTRQHLESVSEGETVVHPGRTGDLDREPDHGEHSYRGSGRLTGNAPSSPAATRESAVPWRSRTPVRERTC
jgi:hypothetical protein